mmetsp:Transcript_74068/g.214225  ORF Transcript_74068/g.214225 Transcript_74068/m.214225 type:complete len:93 (+) Transcript_74068:241-519(+)
MEEARGAEREPENQSPQLRGSQPLGEAATGTTASASNVAELAYTSSWTCLELRYRDEYCMSLHEITFRKGQPVQTWTCLGSIGQQLVQATYY